MVKLIKIQTFHSYASLSSIYKILPFKNVLKCLKNDNQYAKGLENMEDVVKSCIPSL